MNTTVQIEKNEITKSSARFCMTKKNMFFTWSKCSVQKAECAAFLEAIFKENLNGYIIA